MDEAVRKYMEAIPAPIRPLFDRVHRLILKAQPDADVVISYQMPTYKFGRRRLYVGVWKHGVSMYGWKAGGDAGFTDCHPKLKSGSGTIRLRPEDAAAIADREFLELARATLSP